MARKKKDNTLVTEEVSSTPVQISDEAKEANRKLLESVKTKVDDAFAIQHNDGLSQKDKVQQLTAIAEQSTRDKDAIVDEYMESVQNKEPQASVSTVAPAINDFDVDVNVAAQTVKNAIAARKEERQNAIAARKEERQNAADARKEERQNAADARKEEKRQAQVTRRDLYADEAVDLVAKTMQDTGLESIDEQTLSTILTPKQLWYFQKRYNPKSNWGTAAGGRALLGEMNESTVAELNRLASDKVKAQKTLQAAQDASDVAIKTKDGKDYVVGGVTISNKKLNEMKDWGSQITDPNDITPEQVAQLYHKLESYGVKVPKVQAVDANGAPLVDANGQPIMKYDIGTDNMSLYDIKADIDDDGDMALDALGFRNDAGELVVPHRKTYEEMLAERAAAKERIDLLNQQKAADRAKLRLGLSDLAAGIGDMIKASGGAIVNPRDYQAKYDALTAQQKENFNNYLARMQKMKDEEKAKQLIRENRLYQEKQQQKLWEREDAKRAQDHLWKLEEIQARGENSLAVQKEKNRAALDKFNNRRIINFGGVNYTYAEGAKNTVISQLLAIVKPYFNDVNGYKSMLSGIHNSSMSEYGKEEEIANLVICAISDNSLYLSNSDKERIKRVLGGLSSGTYAAGSASISSSAASSAQTNTTATAATTPTSDDGSGGMFD